MCAWVSVVAAALLFGTYQWRLWRRAKRSPLGLPLSGEDVVIVGAGLAGLAAGIQLCRLGMRVRIVERRSSPCVTGSGMSVIGHSLTLLSELGIHVNELGRVQPDVTLREAASGKVAFRVPTVTACPALAAAFGGSVQVNVERGALFKALLDLYRREPNGTLLTGMKLVGMRDAPAHHSGLILEFDTGEQLECALVIGADGVHSATRAYVRQTKTPQVAYRGYSCWRGILDNHNSHDTVLLDALGAMAGDDGRGMFKTVVGISGARSSFTTGLAAPHRRFWVLDVGGLPPRMRVPNGELAAFLQTKMTGYHEAMREIVRRTDLQHNCLQTDVYDLHVTACLRPHARGRVVLIGDAAHPVVHHFGQGACLAFEDAVALCQSIRMYGATPEAIAAYDSVSRRLRATAILLLSRWCGEIYLSPSVVAHAVLRCSFAWPIRLVFINAIRWLLFRLGHSR